MARANSSATITFGLVTVPVKVYTAQSSRSVKFKQLTPEGNATKQKVFDAATDKEVSRSDLLKGYEIAKGKYVTFTPDELKELGPAESANHTMAITEFVDASTVGPIAIEKSHYLGPDKGGDRAYALLAKVLTDKGVVAVAQWTTRNKEHLVTIRPVTKGGMACLVLQTMLYDNEVNGFDDIGVSGVDASEVEIDLAGKLVDTLYTGAYDASQYKDKYADAVHAAAANKAAGQDIEVAPSIPQPYVVDMMEALKMSLEADKKAAKAKPKKKATTKKKTAKKAAKKGS